MSEGSDFKSFGSAPILQRRTLDVLHDMKSGGSQAVIIVSPQTQIHDCKQYAASKVDFWGQGDRVHPEGAPQALSEIYHGSYSD
jgi:hypothetical protein